jgi:hypothetical protein
MFSGENCIVSPEPVAELWLKSGRGQEKGTFYLVIAEPVQFVDRRMPIPHNAMASILARSGRQRS